MIDLRLFQQFIAVAEEASFRKAAERLHVSQPPLSAAIQRLEAVVGTRLFDRTRQYVRLTPAGTAFLDEARRTLAQAAMSLDVARGAADGRQGTLRLSFLPTAALRQIPQLLRAFTAACPTVTLLLSSDNSGIQLEWLRTGRVDVAVLVVPPHESAGLRIQTLIDEALVLALPVDHPLATRPRVQLAELAGESFAGFPFLQSPGYAGITIAACQEAGFFPRIAHEAGEMQTILAFVATGLCVALVPDDMQRIAVDGVAFVPIVSPSGQAIRYRMALAALDSAQNSVVDALFATAQRTRPSHRNQQPDL